MSSAWAIILAETPAHKSPGWEKKENKVQVPPVSRGCVNVIMYRGGKTGSFGCKTAGSEASQGKKRVWRWRLPCTNQEICRREKSLRGMITTNQTRTTTYTPTLLPTPPQGSIPTQKVKCGCVCCYEWREKEKKKCWVWGIKTNQNKTP